MIPCRSAPATIERAIGFASGCVTMSEHESGSEQSESETLANVSRPPSSAAGSGGLRLRDCAWPVHCDIRHLGTRVSCTPRRHHLSRAGVSRCQCTCCSPTLLPSTRPLPRSSTVSVGRGGAAGGAGGGSCGQRRWKRDALPCFADALAAVIAAVKPGAKVVDLCDVGDSSIAA